MFGFGQKDIELTPYLSLAVASIYMVGADGELPDEEMGVLISMFGDDENIIQDAVEYIKQNENLETNISTINALLNNES